MIPFSPPRIDDKTIAAVTEVLKSGWITTGPKTKQFEKELSAYCGVKTTVAVNSWTTGMQMLLHWWGIGPGDEVIVPAYTYCASVNVIIHSGATPVLVDVNPEDFNGSVQKIAECITEKTKAIILVDIGGFPADYPEVMSLVKSPEIQRKFEPNNELQTTLNRILVIADAAHSFGAIMNGQSAASLSDISSFSFHAVKNLTTAEGGALCFNLPEPFDHEAIYKDICIRILHGQNKDALAKTQIGNWRYDVEEPGFKCNMTDIQAAIGLVELARYAETLERRKTIFEMYDSAFQKEDWALLPLHTTATKTTSYHLYQLRINGATEDQRDAIIQKISEAQVSVNVHFQPIPMLTAYKKRGYKIEDYPETYAKYANEISLPVYYDLSDASVLIVVSEVKRAVEDVLAG